MKPVHGAKALKSAAACVTLTRAERRGGNVELSLTAGGNTQCCNTTASPEKGLGAGGVGWSRSQRSLSRGTQEELKRFTALVGETTVLDTPQG